MVNLVWRWGLLFLYKEVKDGFMNWVTFDGAGLESEKGNHANIQRKSFSRQSAPQDSRCSGQGGHTEGDCWAGHHTDYILRCVLFPAPPEGDRDRPEVPCTTAFQSCLDFLYTKFSRDLRASSFQLPLAAFPENLAAIYILCPSKTGSMLLLLCSLLCKLVFPNESQATWKRIRSYVTKPTGLERMSCSATFAEGSPLTLLKGGCPLRGRLAICSILRQLAKSVHFILWVLTGKLAVCDSRLWKLAYQQLLWRPGHFVTWINPKRSLSSRMLLVKSSLKLILSTFVWLSFWVLTNICFSVLQGPRSLFPFFGRQPCEDRSENDLMLVDTYSWITAQQREQQPFFAYRLP